jgi:hypothetical protein
MLPYLRVLPHSVALQSVLSLDLGVCSPGICLTHLTNLTALRTDKLFSLEPGGEAGDLVLQCLGGSSPCYVEIDADQYVYSLTPAMEHWIQSIVYLLGDLCSRLMLFEDRW